jgi:hypothetical protein
MLWEMMISFPFQQSKASKGVGGWVLPFFSTSTKNWVKGIWGGVLQLLNHEPAKLARKESIRNLPQTDI